MKNSMLSNIQRSPKGNNFYFFLYLKFILDGPFILFYFMSSCTFLFSFCKGCLTVSLKYIIFVSLVFLNL